MGLQTPDRWAVTAFALRGGKRLRLPDPLPVQMVTRRQARIALGPDVCATLDAYAKNKKNPWALRVAIMDTAEWYRDAPEIDELAWLAGMDRDQIDALFEQAAQV